MDIAISHSSVSDALSVAVDQLTSQGSTDALLDELAESIRVSQAGTIDNVFGDRLAPGDDVVVSFLDLDRRRVVGVRSQYVEQLLRDINRGSSLSSALPYLVLALPSSGFGREWFDTPEILDLFRREIGKDDDVLIVDPLRADARTRHLQPGVYWRIPRDENGQRRFDIRLRQRTRAGRFVGQRQPVDLVGFGYFYFVDFAAYDWEEVSLSALQRRLPGAVDMFLNQTRAAIERGDRANA